jgi:hypothetical protein
MFARTRTNEAAADRRRMIRKGHDQTKTVEPDGIGGLATGVLGMVRRLDARAKA